MHMSVIAFSPATSLTGTLVTALLLKRDLLAGRNPDRELRDPERVRQQVPSKPTRCLGLL
jgi:hypothetical protein